MQKWHYTWVHEVSNDFLVEGDAARLEEGVGTPPPRKPSNITPHH